MRVQKYKKCRVFANPVTIIILQPFPPTPIPAPPHVQPPPEPITITEGTTVTLHFIVTSHPPATSFTFQYNDRQLEVSGPGISILGGTSLVVMATPRTAAGKYTLVAGNSQGEGSGSVQLIVYRKFIRTLSRELYTKILINYTFSSAVHVHHHLKMTCSVRHVITQWQ